MTKPDYKALRLEAELTISGLAKLAGLDRGTVSSAEKGGKVSELSLAKLRKALENALGRKISAASS